MSTYHFCQTQLWRYRHRVGGLIPQYSQALVNAMKLSDTSRRPPLASTEEYWLNTSRRCGAVPFQIAPPDISAKGSASNKYPASPDACTSCRTVTGCEITSWAFVSRDRLRTSIHGAGKISDSQGNTQRPLNLLDMSALTYYKTSPAVMQGFCSTCGANVFYYRHRRKAGKKTQSILQRVYSSLA
jgi:hypothetical protein